jgi:hypothetical protein
MYFCIYPPTYLMPVWVNDTGNTRKLESVVTVHRLVEPWRGRYISTKHR